MGKPRRVRTPAWRTGTWARVAERREAKGRASSAKPLESRGDLWTHMELWVTTPDVNLGKLVPLEVHGRVWNAKIAKKYSPISEWGVPYTVGNLKRRAFHKLKHTPIRCAVREIRPREVPGLKVGNSRECPGATPTTPRGGGPAEGYRSICMGEPLRVAARSRY